jgi:hypothetical protein
MVDFSSRRAWLLTWHRKQITLALAALALVVFVVVGLVLQGNLQSSSGRTPVHVAASRVASSQSHEASPRTTTWVFTAGVPLGWSVLTKTITTSGGVLVGTTDTGGYQLVSPGVVVRPGLYRISVTLRVLFGGIGLEALDTTGQHFLVNRVVEPRDAELRTISAQFSVHAPGKVFVVLSNSAKGIRSSWMLQAASVHRSSRGR